MRPLLRRQERNRCSQLLFVPFFYEANGVLDAQSDLNVLRRNRITPLLGKNCVKDYIIFYLAK